MRVGGFFLVHTTLLNEFRNAACAILWDTVYCAVSRQGRGAGYRTERSVPVCAGEGGQGTAQCAVSRSWG